ncbi:MAG: hypothetical protein HW389_41 [Bacteroidetes bacterium]|nr:hypothetical protein [Bacteroidota bacterium]MBM2826896.1 hypothetical protein [Dehalococcoidia bacterium]
MSNRFEREIDELLAKLGDFTPRDTVSRRIGRVVIYWQYRWQGFISKISRFWIAPEKLMLSSLLIIVASYFLRFALPGIARYAGVLGVILFFASFLLALSSGGRRDKQMRWRGHPIDLPRNRPAWLPVWLRRWF